MTNNHATYFFFFIVVSLGLACNVKIILTDFISFTQAVMLTFSCIVFCLFNLTTLNISVKLHLPMSHFFPCG